MEAGLLSEIIYIKSRTYDDNNGFNEQVEKYVDYLKCRAQVKYSSGKREIYNNELVVAYSPTFVIRKHYKIDETMKIFYNDKVYRIVSIEPDSKKQCQYIITELINE